MCVQWIFASNWINNASYANLNPTQPNSKLLECTNFLEITWHILFVSRLARAMGGGRLWEIGLEASSFPPLECRCGWMSSTVLSVKTIPRFTSEQTKYCQQVQTCLIQSSIYEINKLGFLILIIIQLVAKTIDERPIFVVSFRVRLNFTRQEFN